MTPDDLAAAVRAAVAAAVDAGDLAVAVPERVSVDRPKVRAHGDYATNVALTLAKPAGKPPRVVADLLAPRLAAAPGIAIVEVAGPGFLNIRLTEGAQGGVARDIVAAGPAYGTSTTLAGQNINLEFVSANPTGPVHIGGTRWAAVGDSLGRLLAASGADVTREYYFNDRGPQIDRFAASLLAAARGEPAPADGYGGDYILEIAKRVLEQVPDALDRPDPQEAFRATGMTLMFAEIRASLAQFGVVFDVYFHEESLYTSGRVQEAIDRLRALGRVYEADGAVWLRSTDWGDNNDHPIVRSDGRPTYIAGDAAYYLDKRSRGFDRCIYLLGADHAGYLGRLKAVAAAFGDDPAQTVDVLIGQLVTLIRDGRPVRMSKRAGTVVTLEDLVDAVGADAARYALARASVDQQIDLDLDLLVRHSNDNPVYYVQYVGARCAGIRRNAEALGVRYDLDSVDPSLLGQEREADLLRALAEFPRIVASAADLRAPHRVARYLEDTVAPAYHRFYDSCPVLPKGDEEPGPLHAARLLLVDATRTVVVAALGLLGVSAPERM